MSCRDSEILEAVLLLHDLGKSNEFIAMQTDLTVAEVAAIIKTGKRPEAVKIQGTLFSDEPAELPKRKPASSWEGVRRALHK